MPQTILVIEDNDQNRYLVTFLLERHGYLVESAPDGARGIELAQSLAPDLILLDIQLPTMHGYDVAQALRTYAPLQRVPIIAVTSYAMVGDREQALAAGCTGYIEKPINPDTFVAQVESYFASIPPARDALSAPATLRILIVDDREANLAYLKALLEAQQYVVEVAHNGAKALEFARRLPPDLVISDLLMPVMDGYTLLRHWRADASLKYVPFIVYTATYTEPEDRRLALGLGADAFILKPAEPESLLATVREVWARAADGVVGGSSSSRSDDENLLEAYSGVLVRKLEEKMLQLEEANRTLQQDIVERVQAQEQLQRNVALLRIAGKAARLGGWAVYLPDYTVIWSDETCMLHDLPPGHTPTFAEAIDFYIPEDRHEALRQIEACVQAGEPFDFMHQILTATGRQIWVRSIGEAVCDENGTIVRIQGAFQDISERKQLEQKLLRAQRMESIATLTGGMAHDLNNVLTPILLSISLLKEEVTDAASRQILDTIESCAQRGTDMVQQVLSFARGHDEAQVGVDLTLILHDLNSLVRDTFPSSVIFRTHIPNDLWRMVGDPTQVHQVFLNLFVNARDAMPNGGQLTVTAENVLIDEHYAAMSGALVRGPHVRISVVDTGVGMPQEILRQIFDPLFTTKPAGKGTGLGLATVAAILRNHRGFVHVYSEVEIGTTFQLYFPTLGAADQPEAAQSADAWQGRGDLILVVDDQAAVRSLTKQTLEAFGYRVVTATDGADAMGVFNRRGAEIALVLTDIAMPIMDGSALIQTLLHINPALRIIAVSGIGADSIIAGARATGAQHFLPKPYAADMLLALIHRVLYGRDDQTARLES